MHLRLPFLLVLLLAAGCVKTDPEDEIGRFAILETRTDHCGDGTLLEAPEERKVIVYLRKVSAEVLHWRQGEELWVLTYDPLDGGFSTASQQRIDMRAGDSSQPSCVIGRADSLAGALAFDADGDAATLTGHLQYDFAPTETSSCDDLMSATVPLASKMPCTIGYDLLGEAF